MFIPISSMVKSIVAQLRMNNKTYSQLKASLGVGAWNTYRYDVFIQALDQLLQEEVIVRQVFETQTHFVYRNSYANV